MHQEQQGIVAIPSADKNPLVHAAEPDFLERVYAVWRINLDPFSDLMLPTSAHSSERDNDYREQKNKDRHKATTPSPSIAASLNSQ
jgi:hypothetical protein